MRPVSHLPPRVLWNAAIRPWALQIFRGSLQMRPLESFPPELAWMFRPAPADYFQPPHDLPEALPPSAPAAPSKALAQDLKIAGDSPPATRSQMPQAFADFARSE